MTSSLDLRPYLAADGAFGVGQRQQVKGHVRLAQNGGQLEIQWQLIRGIPFQGSHPF